VPTYYNDSDPYCAAWLKNLIAADELPRGSVDGRAIQEVRPADLDRFAACHFFAGLGGWAYALKLAGWPVGHQVWTGSCPCQPLSSAGARRGHADRRHLWPAFFRLIDLCRPAVVFGEQVASRAGREWFAAVRADLESLGYAVRAADLPAASLGAPHIRQRLWFVADADRERRGRLGLAQGQGMAEPSGSRFSFPEREALPEAGRRPEGRATAECDWWRAEPGVGRVAYGVPGRVGMLRAWGNAIVPQVAARFIRIAMLD
jgi:DNA (cytosine-5)-methyltransferase 1